MHPLGIHNRDLADDVYWIAIVKPKDPWGDDARVAKERLGKARIVTTEEVLGELLAALRKGPYLRNLAVKMVRSISSNPNVKVVPQSRDSFQKGLTLYDERRDKQYSLQDCISMNVMKSESLTEVLTNDDHFHQEGFTVLMPRKGQ